VSQVCKVGIDSYCNEWTVQRVNTELLPETGTSDIGFYDRYGCNKASQGIKL